MTLRHRFGGKQEIFSYHTARLLRARPPHPEVAGRIYRIPPLASRGRKGAFMEFHFWWADSSTPATVCLISQLFFIKPIFDQDSERCECCFGVLPSCLYGQHAPLWGAQGHQLDHTPTVDRSPFPADGDLGLKSAQ